MKKLFLMLSLTCLSACGAPSEAAKAEPSEGQVTKSVTAPENEICLAMPVCDKGHYEVDGPSACLQDDAVCYERATCGESIWCTGPAESPIECEAYPSCKPGEVEVDGPSACLQDDAVCYEQAVCGHSIWCTGPAASPIQCQAYPACEVGDFQVDSPTACLQDDAACYQASLCGYDIWCTGPRPAPSGSR